MIDHPERSRVTRLVHPSTVDPGVTICPPDGPDLTVDEVRRTAEGHTILGRPAHRTVGKRQAVTYPDGAAVAVVASEDELDEVRAALAGEFRPSNETEAAPVSVDNLVPGVLVLRVAGWTVIL